VADPGSEIDVYADEFSIYSGNANRELAQKICRYLRTHMGQVDVFQFANENIFVRVMENVREQDVFLVQPTCRPVNQSIMELLIMIDAFKRASAGRITAVMPFYSYGRSDKKDQPRVPITARLVADMLTVAGADRVLTMDLHQGQIQGFFSIPVDELTAVNILSRYIKEKELPDMVVVSELGFAKKARNFAEILEAPLAIVEKRRLGNEDKTELMNIIGEVDGKTAVIIDDEIDTAGSLMEAVAALVAEGAREVYSCATHGVFSGDALQKIQASPLTEVIVTDTIPLPDGVDRSRLTVLSVAPLFGEAIKRIHRGESVGALFSSEVQLVEEMTFWGSTADDTGEDAGAPPA
jgi:ribose-phosphate pyrophosphokinase